MSTPTSIQRHHIGGGIWLAEWWPEGSDVGFEVPIPEGMENASDEELERFFEDRLPLALNAATKATEFFFEE